MRRALGTDADRFIIELSVSRLFAGESISAEHIAAVSCGGSVAGLTAASSSSAIFGADARSFLTGLPDCDKGGVA